MTDGEDTEVRYLATPERVLHFDQLHPLIAEAAQKAWLRKDYPAGLKAAWFALRDLARQRLEQPALDGVELMERFGDSEPTLPLTEMSTPSERDMHRGVWRYLVGTAFYVRNPEMHESESPVADDPVGAFERLVVMSICARHLDAASSNVTVEEAVEEVSQPLFVGTLPAADDLVHSVAAGHRGELVNKLMDAVEAAVADGDSSKAWRLRLVYFRALNRLGPEDAPVRAAARRCGRWVANDETLGLAIGLLSPPTYGLLSPRHQDKVALRLRADIRAGVVENDAVADASFWEEAVVLFPALAAEHRRAVIEVLQRRLSAGSPPAQTFVARFACHISEPLDGRETKVLAARLARTVMHDDPYGVMDELQKALNHGAMSQGFRNELLKEMQAQYQRELPGAEMVRLILADFGIVVGEEKAS